MRQSLRSTLTRIAGAAVLLLTWLTLTAAARIPLPVYVESDGIIVRAEEGMESIAKEVSEKAPGFLNDISRDLPGLDVPTDIEIRLVHNSSSLPDVAPVGRGAPSWAAGVAYSDTGIVTVAHSTGTNINDVLSVTAHELSHLALGAALHGRAPRWLNEGFAYLHSSDWSVARTQTLTGLAWSGNTIPLHELDDSFPAAEIEVHKAYAQSYDIVAFLARRGRYTDKKDEGDRWPFRNFLGYIADGETTNDAALRAYGTSMVDLYAEWYEDLRSRFMMVPASLFGLFVWSFAALLLVIGYFKKSRSARRILARWESDERAREKRLELAQLLAQQREPVP
jgi:heme exporter protein D